MDKEASMKGKFNIPKPSNNGKMKTLSDKEISELTKDVHIPKNIQKFKSNVIVKSELSDNHGNHLL
jgi:hypothetical protein